MSDGEGDKPMKTPKKEKKELNDDDIAFKQKEKEKEKALKDAKAKASQKGPMVHSTMNNQEQMNTEQRINLKFLVRLGKTPSQALEMLQQVYGDNTMSRTRVFEWHKRFKEGREAVKDDYRSGRPLTSRTKVNVERVRQVVCDNRRLTVRMVANQLNMKKDSVWKIITKDLVMSEK